MRHFVGFTFLMVASVVFTQSLLAQGLPAGVTPQMMQQVQSMSPAQQQALAKQYGVQLPTTIVEVPGVNVGSVGTPLTQPSAPPATKPASEPSEVKLKAAERYGRSLFDQNVSTFAPTDDAPVPETYRLGVGDQLVVQLFGKENEQLVLQVDRNGDVVFPRLGSITLAGLTFEDARELLKARVTQQLIGVEAVLSMGRLRAIGIFIAGEVRVPGAYSVSALTTVTQALFQAGGVTNIGSLRNIQVRRQGVSVATFDAYDLLMRGDAVNDIRLQTGDVVFVPPYGGVVEVAGEVKRPMVYELAGGETVADLLEMAGSFTQQAYPKLAVLTRISNQGALPTVESLDLYESSTLTSSVINGDVLRVPATGGQLGNVVTLKGAVNRGGAFGWRSGLRVSDIISDTRTDLKREADLSFALIISYKNALLDIEVKQFSLVGAMQAPQSDADPILREFDQILVFSLPDLEGEEASGTDTRGRLLAPILAKLRAQAREDEPVQTVSVSGAVQAPGSYPLFEGTTVASLVRAAGGLLDAAYLEATELRQLREQRGGEILVSYREINLKDALDNSTDYTLASRDHLTVRQIPDWNPQESVVIEGEVEFPGTYLIQPGETLADLVTRAGGLTEDAFAEGAVFTRVEIARKQGERARAFSRQIQTNYASRMLTEETTNASLAEVIEVTAALDQFEGNGRLLIDLPLALTGSRAADLQVEDGDMLVIPMYNPTVTVVGEVMESRSHSHDSNYNVKDYIGLSAGLTVRADDSGIYVVKANGSVASLDSGWWRFDTAKIQVEPGDTIVVPVNMQYKESLATWQAVTSILYQGLVSIAVVAGL